MVLGIAWYREADWPRIKALFPNAGDLPDTYAEWLKTAEATVKRLNARPDVTLEPVIIDLDDFLRWCMVHGHQPNSKARTQYVVEKISRKYPR